MVEVLPILAFLGFIVGLAVLILVFVNRLTLIEGPQRGTTKEKFVCYT
jgi:hypothetical protein